MLFHGRRSLPLVSRSYFSFCWGASTSGSSRSFFSVAHSLRIHRHRRQDYFCHDHTTLRRHSLLQDCLCHALAFSASGSSLSRPLSPPQSPTPSSWRRKRQRRWRFFLVWFLAPLFHNLVFSLTGATAVQEQLKVFKSLYCFFLAVDDHYASCLQTPRAMTVSFYFLDGPIYLSIPQIGGLPLVVI